MAIDTELLMMHGSYKPESCINEPTLNRAEWPELRSHVVDKDRALFEAKREEAISMKNPSVPLPLTASTLGVSTLIEEGLLVKDTSPVLRNPVLGLFSAQFPSQLEIYNRMDRDGSISRILASKENELHEWAQTSAIGESGRQIRFKYLLKERQELVNRSAESISAFDKALHDLRKERFKVATDIQVKELHHIALSLVVKLLQSSVLKDRDLSSAFEKYTTDKNEVQQEVNNYTLQLDEANATVGMCMEELSGVVHEFYSIVPSSCPSHDEFYRIFKNRVRNVHVI